MFVGTVTLTIQNEAPEAQADTFSTLHDTPLLVEVGQSILANDSDEDGDPLTLSLVSGPTHGTLTLHANGTFLYVPVAAFVGADSFTYRVFDGALFSNVVTVGLAVTNTAPRAVDDLHTLTHDLPTAATVDIGILANDTDPDGDRLTLTLLSGVSHGTLTLQPTGAFVYTPTAGFAGIWRRAADGWTGPTALP